MAEVLLTERGKKELEERLAYLKSPKRHEVSEKIKEARGFGDLAENAEYDAAKEEQAAVEGEIIELEQKLRTAKVIADVQDLSTVTIGCFVTVKRVDNGHESEFQIVGTTESDFRNNRVSNESPVGKAVLGRCKNEEVLVEAPKSSYAVVIKDIRR